MKKYYLFLLIFSATLAFSQSQESIEIDNALKQISTSKIDSTTVNLYNKIANIYSKSNPDQGIVFSKKALTLAEKIDWKSGIATSWLPPLSS